MVPHHSGFGLHCNTHLSGLNEVASRRVEKLDAHGLFVRAITYDDSPRLLYRINRRIITDNNVENVSFRIILYPHVPHSFQYRSTLLVQYTVTILRSLPDSTYSMRNNPPSNFDWAIKRSKSPGTICCGFRTTSSTLSFVIPSFLCHSFWRTPPCFVQTIVIRSI